MLITPIAPLLDRIVFRPIADETVRLTNLRSGTVQLVFDRAPQVHMWFLAAATDHDSVATGQADIDRERKEKNGDVQPQ